MGKRLVWLLMAAALVLGMFPGAALATGGGILKVGDENESVRALQTRLKELGYFSVSVTGYFGIVTQQAVIGYQQDHQLTVDGKAGPKTLRSLFGEDASGAPGTEDLNANTYYPGDRGDAVAELQQRLAKLDYYEYGSITGYYGPVTRQAVERFQRVNGLAVDGVAGPETMALLASGHASYLCLYPGDQGPDVARLQGRLLALGYDCGRASGCFDAGTEKAVMEFQAQNGLVVDGKAGKATRLLLGSSGAPWDGVERARAVSSAGDDASVDKMLRFAASLQGRKYVYSTEGPSTFDSAGFVYYVLRYMGATLTRDSAARFSETESWEKITDIRALMRGDLIFFTSGSGVSHAGIYLGEDRFIHASASNGDVTVSRLAGSYESHFSMARRVF
jgi:peptidoglycan hydrolase-like protein with peptidoglycan-binding domain